MNLRQFFNHFKTTKTTNPTFSTIIEDKSPIVTLLGEQQQPLTEFASYGNIPIALTSDVCLRFRLIPSHTSITGIRLKFGTYCRTNHCYITIKINELCQRFPASYLVDNEFVDIPFSTVQTGSPDQSITVEIYADDATDNNVVAVWCTHQIPPFRQTISFQPLVFPAVATPRVSIIIPVFNKVLYTYNCLRTVQANDQTISQEIIIINNASTDETLALLEQVHGAHQIINNRENQGFVQACRQGAALAKGEFVLFLNNDTQVMPGWLANMVAMMDAHPDIGITGSKLIYPDGRLQEAGGIIFSDASGYNYGRLQDPTASEYNYSRPVDYCSGASLMIRKSLWEQIGGFDLRYAPAYYEDTDLCFAARQTGYQVYYCHDSEVIHHEGITAGTDITSGYKAYQAINKDKFVEKWQHVLLTHCPAGTPPEQAIERLSQLQEKSPLAYQSENGEIESTYQARIQQEIKNYQEVENVHALPEIAHYWSNKYLLPISRKFGFSNAEEFYCAYMQRVCVAFADQTCYFVSIGAGNCDLETGLVEMLQKRGVTNFKFECLDINQAMLDRGASLAQQKKLTHLMQFTCTDINGWQPHHQYQIVIANQSLHHFVELELLFTKIDQYLHLQGYFLVHDMIGRNGHQRWPEALAILNEFWALLPERYKYNHLLKRVEIEYDNWDCSTESFEGIRAQDILPLLIKTFSFDLFFAYGNVIDIFIDRCFGHNFEANDPNDQAFIDKVHQRDQTAIEAGEIKPTHLTAALTKKTSNKQTKVYKHLTPEFCVRQPE